MSLSRNPALFCVLRAGAHLASAEHAHVNSTAGFSSRTDDGKRQKTDEAEKKPEVDEELLQLEREVNEVAERVASQRDRVPLLLADRLNDQLQQLRPTVEAIEESEQELNKTPAPSASSSGLPPPAEIHRSFEAAAKKLPGLRCARLSALLPRLFPMYTSLTRKAHP